MSRKGEWEHQEQVALFTWAGYFDNKYPALRSLYAIPNAGERPGTTGVWMAEEGLRRGIPDVLLPIKGLTGSSLYIENKVVYPSGERSKPTTDQLKWINLLREQGNGVLISWYWYDAACFLMAHLGISRHQECYPDHSDAAEIIINKIFSGEELPIIYK